MKYNRDKEALLEHFKKDPILFGYHIGDLDDFYIHNCRWAVTGDDSIEEAVLIYSGLETPTVLAFGIGDNFNRFLESLLAELPDRFYCHYQNQSRPIFEKAFIDKSLGTHLKMKLVSGSFNSCLRSDLDIRRLDKADKERLLVLYELSYPENYFDDRMLETGKYFGCFKNNDMVCVSGIHVHADKYKISILGNITTHPEHRGRGLATAVTAVLVNELRSAGNVIALNVKKDNLAAINCYRKLGFEIYCEYEESYFTRN